MPLNDADTARVEAILSDLETLVAQPGRTFPNFPEAVLADATGLFAYTASAGTEIDRNQRTTVADLRTALGPSGLSLSQLGAGTAVTFADSAWKTAGATAVPVAAALILVDVSGPAELVLSSIVGAVAWRALTAAVAGNPAAGGLPLLDGVYQGHPLRLRLGRTAANLPLIAWDRGRSGLSAATVSIRTA